jgi:phage/plasmid-like protein (TIGR03299 family)
MAHQLEVVNGEGAFYSFREIAWHKLGTVTEDAKSAQEALEIAKLDWQVTKNAIFTTDPEGNPVAIKDKWATTRFHKELGFSPLGVVGNYYEPVQNADAFTFCDALSYEGGLTYETAGSMNDGKRVFLSMKMPETIKVAGGKDNVDLYIMVVNSHDGSSPLIATVTPIRPVCANTVAMALSSAVSTFKIRHTKNATQRVEEARQTLGLTLKYQDEFSIMANHLLETEMSKTEFGLILKSVMPKPEETELNKRAVEAWDNKFSEIISLWDAPTQDNIRGTAWAAYNAVVEWADWYAPVRPMKGESLDVRRAERIVSGTNAAIKDKFLAAI